MHRIWLSFGIPSSNYNLTVLSAILDYFMATNVIFTSLIKLL
jgi:hypothetical protein